MDLDLDKMDLKDLKELKVKVDKAVLTYEKRKKDEAMAALEAHARELGFSINDLVNAKVRKSRGPVEPKFVNPENPEETWSGRGRKPKWFAAAIEAGKSEADLAI